MNTLYSVGMMMMMITFSLDKFGIFPKGVEDRGI